MHRAFQFLYFISLIQLVACNNSNHPDPNNRLIIDSADTITTTVTDTTGKNEPIIKDETNVQDIVSDAEEITCNFLQGRWTAKDDIGIEEVWDFRCTGFTNDFLKSQKVTLEPVGVSLAFTGNSSPPYIHGKIISSTAVFNFKGLHYNYNLTVTKKRSELEAVLTTESNGQFSSDRIQIKPRSYLLTRN